MSTAYAYEKISHAVSVLAVGTGSIQERLFDAFLSMGILSKDCFTGRALEEWESIYARASAHSGPDGNYRATLLTLPTDEAVRLAQDIVELEAMLEAH